MSDSLGMAGIQGALDGAKTYAKSSTIGRIHFAQFFSCPRVCKKYWSSF